MELRLFVLVWFSITSLAHSSHTSNRLPYPARIPPFNPQNSNGYPRPDSGSPFSQNGGSRLFPETKDYDYDSEPKEKHGRCSVSRVYKQSIPAGDVKRLPSLELLNDVTTTSLDACGAACCALGPTKCQYLWIVKDKCLAVACPEREKEKCLPSDLTSSSSSLASVYYKMEFSDNAVTTTTTLSDDGLEQSTTGTVPVSSISQTSGPTPKPPVATTERPTTPIAVINKLTPPTPGGVSAETSRGHDRGITVAIAGNSDITLPTDSTHLFSNTWPEPDESLQFTYSWELLKGPRGGTLSGRDQKDIILSNLVEGLYQLKLRVSNSNGPEWGEAYINVTVHPANRVNSPPVPVILPSKDVTIRLPQNLILDASSSTDDMGSDRLSFHWEEVSGPVGDSAHSTDDPVMMINDLQPGHYTYRLTLTDSDGAKTEAFVNVTVEREQDYPPTANAGYNQLIRLPKKEVFIYGNQSTDDKGIVSYEWVMTSGPGSVDLEGSSTSTLHVRHLDLGTYVFTLTVADTAGQTSSDDVTITVQPEMNEPPVARAGGNQTVRYPKKSVILDGSKSSDDYRLDSYQWSLISGPADVELSDINSNKLTVKGLHIDESIGSPTVYEFMLTVVDYRNLTDNDTVFVIYRKDPQTPPKASAGPSMTITLPLDTVSLDGSKSADDFGIVSYQWERSSNSPAAGVVVNGSDHKPVLILSGLVSGTYEFTLKVTNKYEKTASDTMTLTVLPNPHDPYLLQVQIEGNISNFTQAEKQHLSRTLRLMLEDQVTDYEVIIERIVPFGTHIMVEFYAVNQMTGNQLNSSVAYTTLTENGQDFYFSKFHFIKVDMKVCRLSCSGHGFCDQITRKCRCRTFWMENPFKARFGKLESNCEWSVFYVVLVCLAAVAVIVIAFWLCCCCCLRKRRISRSKRRIRYAILDHHDAEEGVKMLPRDSFHQTTSLMRSESETEEEILFETKKNHNLTPQKNGRVAGEKMGNGTSRKINSPKPNS